MTYQSRKWEPELICNRWRLTNGGVVSRGLFKSRQTAQAAADKRNKLDHKRDTVESKDQ